MNWIKRLSWWVVLPPALLMLGFLLNILVYNVGSNPIYEVRFSQSILWLFLGLGLFLALTIMIGVRLFSERDYLRKLGEQNEQHQRDLRNQRAKTEGERRLFLRRFTHELDTQITILELALEQGEALNSVSPQVEQLKRLSKDVQKITRLRTQPLEITNVDLNYLLKEAIDAVLVKHPGRDEAISWAIQQVPHPLPPIDGDWDLLYRAILNLLDNAFKFTDAAGKVELRARDNGSDIIIEIADSGPGIEEQEQRDIWTEFYRSNRTRYVSGSGMGLPYVKIVTERHGGDIALRSQIGEGSTFTIKLPIVSQNRDL
jgi:signal transduction histidine kinase